MRSSRINKTDLPQFVQLLARENLCVDDIDITNHTYRGLFLEDRLVGGYGLEMYGTDALLRSVVLEHTERGKGYGQALITEAIKMAGQLDMLHVYLLTTTADRLFSRYGFIPVDRMSVPGSIGNTVEFKSFCPSTAVCMKLTIPKYV